MKKKLLLLSFLMAAIFSSAKLPVDEDQLCLIFTVRITDPTGNLGGLPRTPINIPQVDQEGHVLYFSNVSYSNNEQTGTLSSISYAFNNWNQSYLWVCLDDGWFW